MEPDEAVPDNLDSRIDRWKAEIHRLAAEMEDSKKKGDGSRQLSLAVTKLEEAKLWLRELQFPYNPPSE